MKYLIVFFLVSCAGTFRQNQSGLLSVAEQTEKNKLVIDTTEKKGEFYGPEPVVNIDEDIANNQNNILLGLILLPRSEVSYRYVGFLKFLEENKISPKIAITSGFPLFLISHYSFEKKITPLEWYIFKNSKNEIYPMYSKKWVQAFKKTFEDFSKNKKLEQGSFIVQATKINDIRPDPIISSSGKLYEVISNHMSDQYSDFGFNTNFDYVAHLKGLGANKIIIVESKMKILTSPDNQLAETSYCARYENDLQVLCVELDGADDTTDQKLSSSYLIQEGYKKTQAQADQIKNFMEL